MVQVKANEAGTKVVAVGLTRAGQREEIQDIIRIWWWVRHKQWGSDKRQRWPAQMLFIHCHLTRLWLHHTWSWHILHEDYKALLYYAHQPFQIHFLLLSSMHVVLSSHWSHHTFQARSCLRIFVLAYLSAWDVLHPEILMAGTLIPFRSLPKY